MCDSGATFDSVEGRITLGKVRRLNLPPGGFLGHGSKGVKEANLSLPYHQFSGETLVSGRVYKIYKCIDGNIQKFIKCKICWYIPSLPNTVREDRCLDAPMKVFRGSKLTPPTRRHDWMILEDDRDIVFR